MKPFTLQWWLYQYDRANNRSLQFAVKGWSMKSMRYAELAGWIMRRMLRKYGERDA